MKTRLFALLLAVLLVGSNLALAGAATGPVEAPQGDWVGVYGGARGHLLGGWNGTTALNGLSDVTVETVGLTQTRWSASTGDVRALESPDESTRRAGTYFTATSGSVELTFTTEFIDDLHLYALDWDSTARRQTITVDDGAAQVVELAASFNGGAWSTFPISASAGETVTITVTRTAGANAVLAGIFLGEPTSPDAPTGLAATAGQGSVDLAWTAPAFNGGAPILGYNVHRSTTPGGPYTKQNVDLITSTNYTNTAANGSTYYYVVGAVNAQGEGASSNEASATPVAATVPAAPAGLAATAGDGSVELDWTAPGDGGSAILGYEVYRATDGVFATATPLTGGALVTETSYTDSAVVNGTAYDYWVTAVNSVGESAPSAMVEATPATPAASSITVDQPGVAGEWVGEYGGDRGYLLGGWNGTTALDALSDVTVSTSGLLQTRWVSSTTAVRALQTPDESTRRAATYYTAGSGSVELTFGAGYVGNLHLYALDWDSTTRRQTVSVDDGLVQTATLSTSFNGGAWMHVPINATAGETVTITITKTGGDNAVLAGIFLGEAPDPTVPAAPAGLAATAGDGSVELDWTAPGDGGSAILGYEVYRATDGVFATATPLTGGALVTETSYTDSAVVNGTAYDYWVTAVNSVGESAPSAMVEATPAASSITVDQPGVAGEWVGEYGGDRGYLLGGWNGTTALNGLSDVTVETVGLTQTRWASSTTAVRALESPDESTRRAGTYFTAGSGSVELTFGVEGFVGNLHLYALDWDSTTRRQSVSVDDGLVQTATLDTSFNGGAWMHVPIDATAGETVTITITKTGGPNAVLAGIFLGEAPDPTAPAAPAGLAATAGDGSVELDWTAPGDGGSAILGYEVYRATDGVFATATPLTGGALVTETSYTDSAVVNGTAYDYWVTAVNSVGESAPSAMVEATPAASSITVDQPGVAGEWVGEYGGDRGYLLGGWNGTTALDALSDVTVSTSGLLQTRWVSSTTAVRALQTPDESTRRAATYYTAGSGSVELTFGAGYVGNLHLYALDWDSTTRRQTVSVDDGLVQTATLSTSFNGGAWMHVPINATAGETVTITITKTGGDNAVLAGIFLGEAPDPTVPAAPAGLAATAGDGSVELDWTAPGDGGSAILGYEVYRATDGVFATATPLTGGALVTETSYTDSAVVNGTAYDYWVTAVNSVGESAPSAMVEATPAASSITVDQPGVAGEWVGEYGGDRGYLLGGWNGTTALNGLSDVTVETVGLTQTRWASSTTAVRALESPDESTRRAGTYFTAGSGSVELTFGVEGFVGNLHLYALDWDSTTRRQSVSVDDGLVQTATLDTSFNGGAWMHVPIDATAGETVTITITKTGGPNAVLAGIFLGEAPDPTAPAAPAGLAATAGDGSVELDWTAPGDGGSAILGYEVYRATDGVFATATPLTGGALVTETSYTDSAVVNGTAYDYWVTAVNSVGESAPSAMVEATPAASSITVDQPGVAGEWVGEYGGDRGYLLGGWNGTTALDALSDVTVSTSGLLQTRWVSSTTAVRALQTPDESTRRAATYYTAGSGSVELTFGAGYVGNLHLYALDWDSTTRRQTVSVDDGLVQTATLSTSFNGGAWMHVPINATAGETVTITITKTGGDNAVLAGIFLGEPAAPAAPTGVTATDMGSNTVAVEWTAPLEDGGSAVTGYHVYRSTTNDFGTAGAALTAGSPVVGTAYNDTAASPGTTYYYWVTAVNAAGESIPSTEATVATAA